nr:MAG TPA: hypothetical protein [Caudoviricetes sp.]
MSRIRFFMSVIFSCFCLATTSIIIIFLCCLSKGSPRRENHC